MNLEVFYVKRGREMGNFTNDELKRIIDMKPVGNFYPYNMEEYDFDAVDQYIHKVVDTLRTIPNLAFAADFDSHGSGYASYVHIFCWKKAGSSKTVVERTITTTGIRLYICRLAPVAVMGEGEMWKHTIGSSGGNDLLSSNTVDVIPKGNWREQWESIRHVLKKYGYTILDRKFVKKRLPFEATIQTILTDPPYELFDAFFYWED